MQGVSLEIAPVFRYNLAQLLVQEGRLQTVSSTKDITHFRTIDGTDFELPIPNLKIGQTEMVQDHLRWLFGL